MAVIGSLTVKLGLVTVEWDQATKKAKQDAKDLQKAFDDLTGNIKTLYGHWKTLGGAMSLSAVGLASLVHETLQFTDVISDLAKGFDLSIAKTLQFREAIKSSGGNAEGAAKMLSTLFSKIEDARNGNEAAIAQFQKLGIGFRELVSLSPEQALNRVFQAIANIGNTYERVKAVKEMLGKAGIGVEVEAVAQKLGMSVAQFQNYAKSVEKVGQINDDLAATFDHMKIAFADMIAPFTRDGVVSIEKFKAAMVALTAATVVGGLMQLVTLSAKLVAVWKEGVKISAAMSALGGAKGIAQLAAASAAYLAALKIFEVEADKARSEEARTVRGQITDENGKPIAQQDQAPVKEEANRRELIAAQAKLDLAKKQVGFLRQEGQIKLDALTTDKYTTQLREADLARSREIAAAESQRAQALGKENLSEEQKGIIQGEHQTAIAAANEKNRQAVKLIRAERDIANKEELAAARIKEQLSARQLQFIKDEGQIKVDALTSDRYAIQLRESQLALVRDIAGIESQRAQSLNKENLTAQQRKIIEDEYQASVDAAYEKHVQNGRRINAEREREIKLIGVQMEAARKMEGFDRQRLLLEQERVYMTDYGYKVAQEELNIKQRIAELEQQIIDARNRMGAGEAFDAEEKRIRDLIRAEQDLYTVRKQGMDFDEYRRKSFNEGWYEAVHKFAQDAEAYSKLGSDMFNSAIGNMNSAIDNFVKTGKINFKSFAQSIIQDIIAMALKFQAMQLVMSGLRAFGISGPSSMATSNYSLAYGSSSGLGLQMRAGGGDVSANQPYLVGERGPELVIPKNSGTVIPNHSLAGAMGGPSVVYNGPYIASMSAIDTQSGVAFLAKNKQAVWAANQSAQRSLPVSR